mmetsp:Transcript_36077/g.87209  ORF Transcript_36077/g.87209 Transcript_36077/m.87209 type:complete len:107 (+) Transcript_36077:1766-2086(+)
MGEDFSRPHVIDVFGEYDPEETNGEALSSVGWSYATSPVHDEHDAASLKPGEAVFNIKKIRMSTYQAMIQAGIIKDTGKTMQIGMYPMRFPVARVNLEIYKNNEEE